MTADVCAYAAPFGMGFLDDEQEGVRLCVQEEQEEEGCPSPRLLAVERACKRARSITSSWQDYIDQSDADSAGDGDDGRVRCDEILGCAGAGAKADPHGRVGMLHDGSVIPATPIAVSTLAPGSCIITPSFWSDSSKCGGAGEAAAAGRYVQRPHPHIAVCEEANSCFRPYMEDRAAHAVLDGVLYVGCYDGHGGSETSTYLQAHLLRNIHAQLQPGSDVSEALRAVYLSTNAGFRCTYSSHGSTATTAILSGSRLICANVGDSPAFIIKRNGEVLSITQEHKIEGAELLRVTAMGVPIYRNLQGFTYMGTSDGTRWLNMSRAFGDFDYPAISCEPHICTVDVADAKYLVIGSDGLTEKWSVAHAASYLTQLAKHGLSLAALSREMVVRAKELGSTDNITVIVVDLEAVQASQPRKRQQQQEKGNSAAAEQGPSDGVAAAAADSPLSEDTDELL